MKIQKTATAISDGIIDTLAVLGGVFIIFIMLSVCADVIMRYFLGNPLIWVVETAEYSLLYMTFLATAWVLKREGHVKMDLVLNRLNPGTQAILNIITSMSGVIITLVVAWYGVQTTWDHFVSGAYELTPLELPTALIMAIVPIGSFLLFIQFLRRTYGYFRSWRGLRHKE